MVAYLCQWFRSRGLRVAIVSRGYRAAADTPNDEARELHQRLPDVPHIQNPDRVAAVRVAADELDRQVVVLDDGFQHRRLVRDLDIVLIDALQPFGYDRLFPRGLLREPPGALRRAQLVALTRANLITPEQRQRIREQVLTLAPQAGWLELAHVPVRLSAGEETQEVDALHGKRIVAFCGLGNPTGFRRTLEDCGADVVRFIEFPDHHDFTPHDLNLLRDAAGEQHPDYVICTHKDMVKLELDQLEGIPLFALWVEQRILHGQETLDAELERIVLMATGSHAG